MSKRDNTLAKYNSHCAYCGVELTLKSLQVDHLVPSSCGGSDKPSNLMPSCASCNNYKLSYALEEFRHNILRSIEVQRRGNAMFRLLERFGIIEQVKTEVVFYFESQPTPTLDVEAVVDSLMDWAIHDIDCDQWVFALSGRFRDKESLACFVRANLTAAIGATPTVKPLGVEQGEIVNGYGVIIQEKKIKDITHRWFNGGQDSISHGDKETIASAIVPIIRRVHQLLAERKSLDVEAVADWLVQNLAESVDPNSDGYMIVFRHKTWDGLIGTLAEALNTAIEQAKVKETK